MPSPTDPYGGYILQQGDRDPNFYEKQTRSITDGEYVKQLQRDLKELGFGIVGEPNGVFDLKTEWAVREFQIYAKMDRLAQEVTTAGDRYVERLASVENTNKYEENQPISGSVNQQTAVLIQHWKAQKWRCPVVVEAWVVDKKGVRQQIYKETIEGTEVKRDNIWLHDEVKNTIPRMFVRDFSRYYSPFPAGHDVDELILLGTYTSYEGKGGPGATSNHAWNPITEVLPKSLLGKELTELTERELATYRVVRCLSEIESWGYFDAINAYDRVFISVGTYHWSLGAGELVGYLAYLQHQDSETFKKALGNFGIQTQRHWFEVDNHLFPPAALAGGEPLFETSPRKYTGKLAIQQEDGTYKPVTGEQSNYFRTWHWFYRFSMATRTLEGFRRRMWDMSRLRLRDILSTSWPEGMFDDIEGRRAQIRDIYTSEKAVAFLLRWHIFLPGNIVAGGRAGQKLINAYNNAPTKDQPGLIKGLLEEAKLTNSALLQKLDELDKWPKEAAYKERKYTLTLPAKLSNRANSFKLDESGLPPIALPSSLQPYGGYILQKGDEDGLLKYAGQIRKAANGEPIPDDTDAGYVRELQKDLKELGFLFIGTPDGKFSEKTRQAVLEFQRATKYLFIAQQTSPTAAIVRVRNTLRYTGPVNGKVNEATRFLIKQWRKNGWYHPIILFSDPISPPTLLNDRTPLWLYNDLQREAPQVYAKDLSQHYAQGLPPSHRPDESIALGHYFAPGELLFSVDLSLQADLDRSNNLELPLSWRQQFASATPAISLSNSVMVAIDEPNFSWIIEDRGNSRIYTVRKQATNLAILTRELGGPRTLNLKQGNTQRYRHCWSEVELSPLNWLGKTPAQLSEAEQSTFLLLRAVAEAASPQESSGFADSMRAYDRILPAFGLLNLQENGRGSDWFAFLAYLRYRDPSTFNQAFESFGIRADKDWADGNGSTLFNKSQRSYSASLAAIGDSGDYESVPLTDETLADYFGTWQWFYRLVMAVRTLKGYRLALWDFARIRLREVLGTPWPVNTIPHLGARRALLGDVYTSERAIASIFYWYLRFPADIVNNAGEVADRLQSAFARAKLSPSTNPLPGWRDIEEQKLIQGLIEEAQAERSESFGQILQNLVLWPAWNQVDNLSSYQLTAADVFTNSQNRQLELRAERQSFQFDSTNLTPPIPKSKTARQRAIPLSGIPTPGQFGVVAIAEEDDRSIPGTDELQIVAAVLTMAGDDGSQAVGLKLPIIGEPVPLNLPASENPSGQLQRVYTTFNGESEVFDIYDIKPDAPLPVQGQPWKLDLTAIEDVNSALLLDVNLVWHLERNDDNIVRTVNLEVKPKANFFKTSPQWFFAAAGTPLTNNRTPNTAYFSEYRSLDPEPQLEFSIDNFQQALQYAWTLTVPDNLAGTLLVGFLDGKLSLKLEPKEIAELRLDLGSPLAKLVLKLPKLTLDSIEGLSVSFTDPKTSCDLFLDIFALAKADQKIINHLWGKVDETIDREPWLIKLTSGEIGDKLNSLFKPIFWNDFYPTIHQQLWALLTDLEVNDNRRLQAFTGNVLGSLIPCQLTFTKGEGKPVEFIRESDRWLLKVLLKLQVKGGTDGQARGIFSAQGHFGFTAALSKQDPLNYIDINSGAFFADDEVDLTVTDDKYKQGVSFGEILSLHIPKDTVFTFSTDPRNPQIEWDSKKSIDKTPSKIAIRIPAAGDNGDITRPEIGRFTFEMEKFVLKTAGFDLKGAVRVESVELGDGEQTGFKEPLAIKGVQKSPNKTEEPKIGEIEFHQSRLVAGSLQAVAYLTYFDDAVGTFTLFVSQNEASKELAVVGTLDITGISEFHVNQLFATFQISLLHLETRYLNQKWSSKGQISGKIKFQPAPGRSSSEMGALAALFDGVVAEFENLDPVRLEFSELSITFPPKQFEFGSIFLVDLRGIVFIPKGEAGEAGFGLLGDIAIQRLPGVDAQLTFGGITLKKGNKDSSRPDFSLSRIGAGFTVAGGFTMSGVLDWIKDDKEVGFDDKEVGFAGAISLKTDVLPKIDGLIKLTRIKTSSGDWVPSLAVYLETELEVALFAGFYLRSLGLGLGINQALDGLQVKTLPLSQRIIKFVDNPKGLPEPRRIESWVPNPPASANSSINWMLVASGLITLGNLPPDTEHPLAGSILLAIDGDLDIVAGINIWLFCSPEQTRQPQFFTRPVGRGAIAISPREEKIFGMFRTIKNPKLSDKCPPLLMEVLSKVDTSLMFVADRKGFLLEVGWPWETKIPYEYTSLLRGTLTAGFRFGIYRGVISFGLNFAINIVLNAKANIEFNTRLGSAGASFSVYGEGYFRCSFIGALKPASFETYLFGSVRVGATVAVRVEAHCGLSKKICGIKIRLRISISASLNLSISAALDAAMYLENGKLALGFNGEARVAVSVSGYGIAGNVPFQYREHKVTEVDRKLKELLPRQINAPLNLRPTARLQPLSARSVRPTGSARAATVAAPSFEIASDPWIDESASTSDRWDLETAPTVLEVLEEPAAQPIWNYRFCRVQKQIRVLLFPKSGVPEPGREYPALEKLLEEPIADVDGKFQNALAADGDRSVLRKLFPETGDDSLSDNFSVVNIRQNYWQITDNVSGKTYSLWLKPGQVPRFDIYRAKSAARFQVSLKSDSTVFLGFLGSDLNLGQPTVLAWEETLDRVVLTAREILESRDPQADPPQEGEVRDLLLGDFLVALGESTDAANNPVIIDPNQEEIVDRRTQNPVLANNDDETAGIAPEGYYSPNFKADYDLGDRSYDRKLIDACQPPKPSSANLDAESEGLSSGLLMAELVALLKDPQVRYGQNAPAYPIASPLNLILVFPDPGNLNEDPIEQLLDLNTWQVNGELVKLESVLGDKAGQKLEYDLIVGPYFQDNSRINLTWEFKREDDTQSLGSSDEPQKAIGNAYQELDRFVVTRTILQQPTQSRTEIIHPVWILTPQQEWLRPPFQYIDEHLSSEEGIEEGSFIQYRIDALTLDDRRLAGSIVNVIRQTVKILTPPTQSLALHQLKPATDKYSLGNLEIAAIFSESEKDVETQLQVRYRFVRASTVGAYGFESNPEIKVAWSELEGSSSSDSDSFQIRYANAEQNRSIPWEEVRVLNVDPQQWHQLSFLPEEASSDRAEEEKQVVYRLAIPEEEFWRQVGMPPAGEAVELFVGRERKPQRANESLQRSQLVRCRHAIKLPEVSAPLLPDGIIGKNYFRTGNTVAAIERIPALPPEVSYLNPQLIEARADYESLDENIWLRMTWLHDRTCRGGNDNICPLADTLFNPVVGYRIHRLDRYSPTEWIWDDGKSGLPERPEVLLRVMPELMYRSLPSTIAVSGRKKEGDKSEIIPDWQVKFLDLEHSWETEGNWSSPAAEPLQLVSDESGPVWLLSPIAQMLQAITELLNKTLPDCQCLFNFHFPLEDRSLEAVQQDGANLPDRLAKLALPQEQKSKTLNWWSLDEKSDPFGWWAMESLGLSCECFFQDGEGYPVKVERILELLSEHPFDYPVSLALFLAEDGVTLLNVLRFFYSEEKPQPELLFTFEVPPDEIQAIALELDRGKVALKLAERFPPNSSFQVFATSRHQSQDRQWLIYDRQHDRRFSVVQPQNQPLQIQVYTQIERFSPWKIWQTVGETPPYCYLSTPLGIKFKGRIDLKPYEALQEGELEGHENDKNNLIEWLKKTKKRLESSIPSGEAGRVIVYQYNLSNAGAQDDLSQARSPLGQLTLPIGAAGQIHYNLPVGDRWAHQYAVALETVRRYDVLWHLLSPARSGATEIPYPFWREILVERTEPLVPHNIVATPLVGGIQSLIFVHPAAFAATASAVNAVYGQYSGQTAILQRRIGERELVLNLYRDPAVFNIDWKLYQQWLNNPDKGTETAYDFEAIEPGSNLLAASDSDGSQDITLQALKGTELGVYGADRYVYPDLPGYYEYRVLAYSSAGRICSPVRATNFISPLYDQKQVPEDKTRQQPRTVSCRDAIFDPNQDTLQLKIRLIHPRFHLRDEIRPLWVAADEVLDLQEDSLLFGSLPDLYLTYQLYLRTNPDEDEGIVTPVLVPLAEIAPPLGKSANPSQSDSFYVKAQIPGATINGSESEKLSAFQATTAAPGSRLKPGEIYLDITLQLSDPRCATVVSTIRAHLQIETDSPRSLDENKLRKLIYLAVAREGIWSDIVSG